MFCVVYQFKIKKEKNTSFINAWLDMTNYLKENRSAMGSRLHQIDETTYFAYAQWPNEKAWLKNKSLESEESNRLSKKMSSCLIESITTFYGEVVSDALE